MSVLACRIALLAAGVLLSAASMPSWAQPTSSAAEWRVSAGVGAFEWRKYPGGRDSRTVLLPLVDITYGNWFFANLSEGIGANFVNTPRWRLGIAVVPELEQRKESDDGRLRGLGDVDRTARLRLTGARTWDWLTLRARVGQDALGRDAGTLVDVDLLGRAQPSADLSIVGEIGTTWADTEYMRTFFGVSDAQSRASGLPTFEAKRGIRDAHLALGGSYTFARAWTASVRFGAARLHSSAQRSPINRDTLQPFASISLLYRF